MSWSLVARKDVGDSIRERQLYVLVALFGGLGAVLAWMHAAQARAGFAEPIALVEVFYLISIVVVPATALMLAHEAIVRPRVEGEYALMLGLPHSRLDLVIGTYVGRVTTLTLSLVVGVLVATVVTPLRGASVPWIELGGFLLASVALGVAYVAIGLALSASVRSTTWAAVGAFGTFLLFIFLWRFVPGGLASLLNGLEAPAREPGWVPYVSTLSPSVAFELLTRTWVLGEDGGEVPPGFALAVLAGWTVLAPAIGYLRFARSDL